MGSGLAGQPAEEPHLCVHVDPEAACGISHQVSVLSICGGNTDDMDLSALKLSMRSWSHDKELSFGLKNVWLSAAASKLLSKFVLQRSFPHCAIELCCSVDAICQTAAEELQAAGAIEERGYNAWSLTQQAVASLVHMHAVRRPQKVFKSAEELAQLPLENLDEFSSWELLQILWHNGWHMQRGPQKVSERRRLPPIKPQSPRKVFYAPSVQLSGKQSMAYLKALCLAETLFAHGFVQAIHHGQNEKYYLSILDQTHDGQVPPEELLQIQDQAGSPALPCEEALEMDVEEHLFHQDGVHARVRPSSVLAADPLERWIPLEDRKKVDLEEHADCDAGSLSDAGLDTDVESFGFVEADDDAGEEVASLGYSPSYAASEELKHAAMANLSHDNGDEEGSLGADSPASDAAAPKKEDEDLPAAVAEPRELPQRGGPAASLAPDTRKRVAAADREIHPDSFQWGPFRFTFTTAEKRPPHGQYQAHCPFHRLSDKTGCTRAMQVGPSKETKEEAKRMLQSWCLLAPLHSRKRHHTAAYIKRADVLPQEILDQKLTLLRAPAAKAATDQELDDAEEVDNSAKKSAKAKAKRKGKAEPKEATKRKRKREAAEIPSAIEKSEASELASASAQSGTSDSSSSSASNNSSSSSPSSESD